MRFHIITLFPEFFAGPLSSAMMQRARDAGIVHFSLYNPRDAATDRHRSVDDRPYGGGPGMVMLPGPIASVLRSLGFGPQGQPQPGKLIFLSPKGEPLSQAFVRKLAFGGTEEDTRHFSGALPCAAPDITLICGRYEGMDARIEACFPVECISVGDFILNGGEAAAVCLIEAVTRLLPGFMGHGESGEDESFSCGLLEYPHYTRPEIFEGLPVPEVLRSGNHARIALWRRQASLALTLEKRPRMLQDAPLSAEDREFLRRLARSSDSGNLYCALVRCPDVEEEKISAAAALTNDDIRDIAHSSGMYGLGGCYVLIPPPKDRSELRTRVRDDSNETDAHTVADRKHPVELIRAVAAVEDIVAEIEGRAGRTPLLVGACADRPADCTGMSFPQIAAVLHERPVLLLFGAGHRLSPELRRLCHAFAPPVRGHGTDKSVSVGVTAAIQFDRILGDWR